MTDTYHQLWHVEAAFRMSKHDLAARLIFHRREDSIQAHLTIVFAALAIGQWIETTTGLSLRRFLQLLRPIRTEETEIAGVRITAEHTINPQALAALHAIKTNTH